MGIIAIHGFYPAYWVGIHHEWVQPFNYLVENDINTFFYKYDWNDCPSSVAIDFNKELNDLINKYPNINQWQVVGHSMGGTVVLFSILNSELNENFDFTKVSVCMVRRGKFDTENSQFFILIENHKSFYLQYTPIGKVISDLEILKTIKSGDTTFVLRPDKILDSYRIN